MDKGILIFLLLTPLLLPPVIFRVFSWFVDEIPERKRPQLAAAKEYYDRFTPFEKIDLHTELKQQDIREHFPDFDALKCIRDAQQALFTALNNISAGLAESTAVRDNPFSRQVTQRIQSNNQNGLLEKYTGLRLLHGEIFQYEYSKPYGSRIVLHLQVAQRHWLERPASGQRHGNQNVQQIALYEVEYLFAPAVKLADLPKGIAAAACPKCGAAIKDSAQTNCEYCGIPLQQVTRSGEPQWAFNMFTCKQADEHEPPEDDELTVFERYSRRRYSWWDN